MAYENRQKYVGKKYTVVNNRGYPAFSKGEVVEITRIDCDGDFVVTGERDFYYIRCVEKLNADFEPYFQELDDKWIVWNDAGSLMAVSEEDAKAKAEELLNKGYNGPIYIAKAIKKAQINAVVWSE